MKLQSLSVAAFAVSILVSGSLRAHARPVTTADLSGKMICWSNGHIQSFEADGKSAGSDYTDGTWSIGANGVEIDVASGGGANVDIEIQPDGTFTFEAMNGGATQRGAGKSVRESRFNMPMLKARNCAGMAETWKPTIPVGNMSIAATERGL